ncbi:MAG TPA: hypothetical protein EYP60_05010 [bacterium (Candidatus Stahlbacteria)]|nr:hypothetical protein [Candidatus Stahlbacteria bacterium]
MRKILSLMIFTFWTTYLFGQIPNLDWKVHDVGKIRQVITNQGALWAAETDYTDLIYCLFPPGSNEEHIGEGGLWVGAIKGTPPETLVSVTTGWNSPSHFEMYPTDSIWDTIWVVEKYDTVDIPYWHNYVSVSDQDFVCRYSDDFRSVVGHNPLNIEVIQRSYAWGFEPMDEVIILDYLIISKKDTLHDVYLAFWLDANIGDRLPGWGFAMEDRSYYNDTLHMGVSVDGEGGIDGDAISPIAAQIFAPDVSPGVPPPDTTFEWYGHPEVPPEADAERYLTISNGNIEPPQAINRGAAFTIGVGPYEMSPGDTLPFTVALICGFGIEGVEKNAANINAYYPDWKFPSAPPPPPLKVQALNHAAKLSWKWEEGDPGINPEEYEDDARRDAILKPFEGYRVYKSTMGAGGPWFLLAEYDREDDPLNYGYNTGLEYAYVDSGLLNNIAYYYSVTSYCLPDTVSGFPELESSITKNVKVVYPGPPPATTVGEVAVVPNPYLGNIDYTATNPPWETHPPGRPWMEQDRRIQFIHLPKKCTIKIYTLAGDLVKTIEHDDPYKGFEDWNLVSSVGQAIGSGIYIFTVKDHNTGKVQVGKFTVIK